MNNIRSEYTYKLFSYEVNTRTHVYWSEHTYSHHMKWTHNYHKKRIHIQTIIIDIYYKMSTDAFAILSQGNDLPSLHNYPTSPHPHPHPAAPGVSRLNASPVNTTPQHVATWMFRRGTKTGVEGRTSFPHVTCRLSKTYLRPSVPCIELSEEQVPLAGPFFCVFNDLLWSVAFDCFSVIETLKFSLLSDHLWTPDVATQSSFRQKLLAVFTMKWNKITTSKKSVLFYI